MKDKTTAGIFALLLGFFGAHKFYLNKTGIGILYLFFCWTFIPFFISFIEGIIFLTMDDEIFNTKYNDGNQTKSNKLDNIDAIEKLHSLKEKGVISEEEFQSSKEKLM
jgi:TM2 domain-containing membrane protein YozV